jgi:hypothetical protein
MGTLNRPVIVKLGARGAPPTKVYHRPESYKYNSTYTNCGIRYWDTGKHRWDYRSFLEHDAILVLELRPCITCYGQEYSHMKPLLVRKEAER